MKQLPTLVVLIALVYSHPRVISFTPRNPTYNVLEDQKVVYKCRQEFSVNVSITEMSKTDLTMWNPIVINSRLNSNFKDRFSYARYSKIYNDDYQFHYLEPTHHLYRNQTGLTYRCNDHALTLDVYHKSMSPLCVKRIYTNKNIIECIVKEARPIVYLVITNSTGSIITPSKYKRRDTYVSQQVTLSSMHNISDYSCTAIQYFPYGIEETTTNKKCTFDQP